MCKEDKLKELENIRQLFAEGKIKLSGIKKEIYTFSCQNCWFDMDFRYVGENTDVICPYCGCETRPHRQKLINIPDTMAFVDENIEELIKILNKFGLRTVFSCEGDRNSKSLIMIKMDNIKTITVDTPEGEKEDLTLSIQWEMY